MKIGILGTGTISSAVVEGMVADGHQITVSERNAARAADLSARFENVTVADNQGVLDASEVVFLGLMAAAAPGILADLTFRPDQKVISLMAQAELGQVGDMVAPAKAEAVMIPFPAIATGGSAILVLGDTATVQALFGDRNRIFPLSSQEELDAYQCAQAVLSPAVKLVGGAASWLGTRTSDAAQGESFLRHLVASGLMGAECAPLLEALNTPGGYNQQLRQHMERAGMADDLANGLDLLEKRSE